MPWNLFGAPATDDQSGYEWSGEWTVTYETFRDMGIAFMAALVLIYGLIVWEFRNFTLAGLIMSPIPLTLLGIIPGHWIMGAEFTATSMIGMIALGGIIVRQSILIVEFVKIEVSKGKDVREAAIHGAEVRMRPILITTLTVMAGAFAIIHDPIFSGLAISTLFGAGVATAMAVLVVPLGCISARRQFYVEARDDGTVGISPAFLRMEKMSTPEVGATPAGTPLWMRLYGAVIPVFAWSFYILRAVITMLGMGFKALLGVFGRRPDTFPPVPPGTPPPSGGVPPVPVIPPTMPPAPTVMAAVPAAAAATSGAMTGAAQTMVAPVVTPAPVHEAAAPPHAARHAMDVDDADHSGEDADELSLPSGEGEEGHGTVRKRRGIRLKQFPD
jgi:hypothetical protein